MRLSELVRDLPINGSPDLDPTISGICHDSRRIEEGDLFAALVGQRFDGRIFVSQAVDRGAVAILASGPPPPEFALPWLSTGEPRRILGPLAARLYRHPDRELSILGVTGTNGKSTVVRLLSTILGEAGRPTGSIGTLGYRFQGRSYDGVRTTPEASDLLRALRSMLDAGAEGVALEVSSHALALGRVEGIAFDLALFTNLTRDHFDFHHDFEEYFAAKRSLFERLKPGGRAVINIEDPWGRRLADERDGAMTFGAEGEVRSLFAEFDGSGIRGAMATPRGDYPFSSPLLGAYNLENLVAAAAAAEALAIPHEVVTRGFAAQGPLPGRMEPVNAGQPFPVIIDYAHTDAALEAALRSLRGFSGGKILLVFGCGGDRDPGKRGLMGRVAGQLADFSIITSDNPRGEDPLAIISSVEEGLRQSGSRSYRILPDRREAIRRAIGQAGPEWSVLVAGKGHEEVQIVGGEELPFSDREEARQALEERFGSRKAG